MRIFLIGYMGCGKTTLGKQLANKLGYRFADQDEIIEASYGMPITDVFARFGEEHFRNTERVVMLGFANDENVVISSGGGTPCFFDNMEQMNAIGETVYLKITPGMLASRLKHGKNKRPLIKDKTDEELLAFVREKLTEREPFYSKARYILEGDNLKTEDIVQIIKNKG
jgi:shikimate kinase